MNAAETMNKLYEDIEYDINNNQFKNFEVVEVKESIYRKVITAMNEDRNEDEVPEDIFDLTILRNQIYFYGTVLLKPVVDNEIEADFKLTTSYQKDVTGMNFKI